MISPSRPDLFLGELIEKPRKLNFEVRNIGRGGGGGGGGGVESVEFNHGYYYFSSLCSRSPLQDHKELATELQESTGFFYRVRAKPTTLKFSAAHMSMAPARPPPPSNTPPQSSKARTGSSSEPRESRGGKGFGNLFHHHKSTEKKKGGFV